MYHLWRGHTHAVGCVLCTLWSQATDNIRATDDVAEPQQAPGRFRSKGVPADPAAGLLLEVGLD